MLKVYGSNGLQVSPVVITDETHTDKRVKVSGPIGDAKLEVTNIDIVSALEELNETMKEVRDLLTLLLENIK